MAIAEPTKEENDRVVEMLHKLAALYNDLVTIGHTFDIVAIPKTDAEEDVKYVCQIIFRKEPDGVVIDINLLNDQFTHDEIYVFLQRTEKFMSNTLLLQSVDTSTAH